MFGKLFKTLFVLTLGGLTISREYFTDRREKRLIRRLTLGDIRSIGDQTVLAGVVRYHDDREIVRAAIAKLKNQRQLEFFAHDERLTEETRIACIRQLADENVLVNIVLRGKNVIMAQAAAERLTEAWAFRELLRSPMVTVRSIAAQNCRDVEVLYDFYADADERVRDFAETSLAELGIDPHTRMAAGVA